MDSIHIYQYAIFNYYTLGNFILDQSDYEMAELCSDSFCHNRGMTCLVCLILLLPTTDTFHYYYI